MWLLSTTLNAPTYAPSATRPGGPLFGQYLGLQWNGTFGVCTVASALTDARPVARLLRPGLTSDATASDSMEPQFLTLVQAGQGAMQGS